MIRVTAGADTKDKAIKLDPMTIVTLASRVAFAFVVIERRLTKLSTLLR